MHAPSGSQVTSGHRVIVRFYGSAVHSYDLGALSAQSVFQQLCKKAVQISLKMILVVVETKLQSAAQSANQHTNMQAC